MTFISRQYAGAAARVHIEQVVYVAFLFFTLLTENAKLTYSHGAYLFHYICENRIIYMCITDDNYERSKAFAFLSEIKKRFMIQYGERVYTALPYAMNR